MAILFDCPFCSYEKEVPDSYDGKKIKCPRCLATLTLGVPQPTALTALQLPEDDVSPLEQTAIEVGKTESLVECPYCFELIDAYASECPNCQKTLGDKDETDHTEIDHAAELATRKKARSVFYLGLASLICGIGAILGPIGLLAGLLMRRKHLKARERELVNAALFMSFIGTVGSLILGLGLWLGR